MAFPPVPFQEWFLRQTSTGNAALNAYVARVKADGGVVEAIGCIPLAVWDWAAPSFVGLLDLYPNAAAAYSLRKLRAAYSGSAVRVRKEVSTVSSETDIGFLADGSLDTVSLLAFASDADSGDVFVVTWYDQSLSNDATQSTAAAQPKIVSGGSLVTENGKPAIDFEHSGTRTPLNISNNIILGTNNLYISSVVKNKTNQVNNWIDSSTNGIDLLFINNNAVISKSGVGSILSSSSAVNNLDIYLIDFLRYGGNMEVYFNGNSDGSIADSTDFSVKIDFIGDDEVILQEIILFDSDQSANRTGIETNINTFYSIYP